MNNVTPITAARRWAACTVQAQAEVAHFVRQQAAIAGLDDEQSRRMAGKYMQFAGAMKMSDIKRDILREIDGERA